MSKIDTPALQAAPKPLVFVKVPAENNFDFAHPDIIINGKMFKAGETYQVDPDTAFTIEDRITKYRRSQVRLNNPSPDSKTLKEAALHGSSKSGNFVAPHSPDFS